MEYFDVSLGKSGFHIEGFPDSAKLIALNGPKARRLADLALHEQDLQFALDSLEAINTIPNDKWVVRQSLWRSAIIHVVKCFGTSRSRFSLHPESVLKGEPPEAIEVYQFFKKLRNHHYVHDGNSFAQALPGAVIAARTKPDQHRVPPTASRGASPRP